jgi:multiple sugar transport system permease protein
MRLPQARGKKTHGDRYEDRAAWLLIFPFVAAYLVLFLYPTYRMAAASFTDASLTLPGEWIGFENFRDLLDDRKFQSAIVNTGFFVLLTVVPSTLLGLLVAMMIERLAGVLQTLVLAFFFLPYVLPASVVANMWWAIFDHDYSALAPLWDWIVGRPVSVFRIPAWVLPVVAVLTVWWTIGFNVLLFLAGLRNIPRELYEAGALDGAGRLAQFRAITWPLIWPVTALVLTIQLILQMKVFDQVYLLSSGHRSEIVLVQYLYIMAFQQNRSGYGSAIALGLFVIVMAISVLQYQLLRARGQR